MDYSRLRGDNGGDPVRPFLPGGLLPPARGQHLLNWAYREALSICEGGVVSVVVGGLMGKAECCPAGLESGQGSGVAEVVERVRPAVSHSDGVDGFLGHGVELVDFTTRSIWSTRRVIRSELVRKRSRAPGWAPTIVGDLLARAGGLIGWRPPSAPFQAQNVRAEPAGSSCRRRVAASAAGSRRPCDGCRWCGGRRRGRRPRT